MLKNIIMMGEEVLRDALRYRYLRDNTSLRATEMGLSMACFGKGTSDRADLDAWVDIGLKHISDSYRKIVETIYPQLTLKQIDMAVELHKAGYQIARVSVDGIMYLVCADGMYTVSTEGEVIH